VVSMSSFQPISHPAYSNPSLPFDIASLARSALEIHTYRNIKPCGGHRTTSVKARREVEDQSDRDRKMLGYQ